MNKNTRNITGGGGGERVEQRLLKQLQLLLENNTVNSSTNMNVIEYI